MNRNSYLSHDVLGRDEWERSSYARQYQSISDSKCLSSLDELRIDGREPCA
jgi:hypothetical protein